MLWKSWKTESKISLQRQLCYISQKADGFIQCSFGDKTRVQLWRRVKAMFQIQLCQNLINSWHELSSLLLFPWSSLIIWTVNTQSFYPRRKLFFWHCEPILIGRLNLCYRARHPACTEEPLTFIFMNSNVTTNSLSTILLGTSTHTTTLQSECQLHAVFLSICLNAGN